MQLVFEINTKPVPQARPRFYVRHNGLKQFVGAYDPAKCKTFKEVIAWHAKINAMERGLKEPVKDPIVLSLTFQMGENGKEEYHTKRPDIDNLAKAVKDALRGIIYHDDSQIVEAHLFKKYGEQMVRIEIKTLEGN
jgi:Holliday junction resolvase RusA-like endonuclease